MDAQPTVAQAFGLLSDAIRVDILRAVADAQHEKIRSGIEAGQTGVLMATLTFSEIYQRVDVDNTSKFSYHLGELTGTFLKRGDDGYSFTHAGEQIARFILARNHRTPAAFGPIEADGSCLFCGAAALEGRLDEQICVIACSACDRPVTGYMITPAQIRSHDEGALLESLKRKQAGDFTLVQQGLCPACTGRTTSDVVDIDAAALPIPGDRVSITVDECVECRRIYSGLLSYAAAYHPASAAFLWDRGLDIRQTGLWELHHYVRDGRWSSERVGTDPVEYQVTMHLGEETFTAHLDGAARVTRTERVRGRALD